MLKTTNEPDNATLLKLLGGFQITQALYVVAKLGVADRILPNVPLDADFLAKELVVQPKELYRVLRTLASVGVFAMNEKKEFSLTPVGEYLREDHPNSLKYLVIFQGEEPYHAFGALLSNIKTGKNAFDFLYGMGHFEYLAKHSNSNLIFNRAMTGALQVTGDIFANYDFNQAKTIVDIGGGRGFLIGNILNRHPNLSGILYDLPDAVTEAPTFLKSLGVEKRCQIIIGSAFELFPPGGDTYILSRVLHDFTDDRALKLLQNCREVIPATGTLLLCEAVLPEGPIPPNRARLDLMMMVMNEGKERTESEWKILLRKSGFKIARYWKTQTNHDLIEVKPEKQF